MQVGSSSFSVALVAACNSRRMPSQSSKNHLPARSRGVTCGITLSLLSLFVFALTGCGTGTGVSFTTPGASVRLSGNVHGGQQPIAGAEVFLYSVSTSANGAASTSLLSSPGYVTTDTNGAFNITGDYTCPSGGYVYLLAVGGNPGLAAGTSNAKIALASGVGPCSSLTPGSFFSINEVTTVATAAALAAYTTSDLQIGATSNATLGLQNAFNQIQQFSDLSLGVARTQTSTGNGTVPQAKLNTLADILAACVNSDGTGSPCTSLMNLASVSTASGQQLDTFQAALNIAQSPTTNVTSLFNLSPANAVFQPVLASAPADWSLALQYPATVTLSPGASSIVTGGQRLFTANIGGGPAGTLSYQWSTTGTSGLLVDPSASNGTGQSAYCSATQQATYVSNGVALSANALDNVTVRTFSGAGCVAANALGTATSIVTVLPTLSSVVVPTQPVNATQIATVVLPSGMKLTPDQLTVLDSLGQVTPAASGTFALPTYTYASQVAVVLNSNGNPILLGWLDPTHQTVSAGTTAEVLAYLALGGPLMYTVQDREALEAAIVTAPGLPALTQAISSELAANPDALDRLDPVIQSALNTFFTSVSGVTPRANLTKAVVTVHANAGAGGGTGGVGILIQPGEQSGMFVEQASGANDIDAVNKFRRRAHVFVTPVSDTDASGIVTADNGQVTEFDLSPTTGLSGGVAGAITDIYNFYWGSGTTAYGPVTSDPVVVPVTSGFAKTTYTVTAVGAGANTATYAALTPAQANQQVQTAVLGFVSDALIPFLSNYIFGSGFFSSESGAVSFVSNWKTDLENDVLAFVGGAPALKAQIMKGDYPGALAAFIDNVRQAGSLRDLIILSLEQASGKLFAATATAAAMQSVNVVLNAAGGVLQIYDSSIMASQLLQSDAADQWTVINGGQKVTLTPASASLSQFGSGVQNLTVALPGVSSTLGYSYYWTSTASAGDLAPADASLGASPGFCTSDATATYTVHTTPILQKAVVDKIFVQAFSSGGCRPANQVGTSPTAAITVGPDAVILTPQSSSIPQTGQQTLTAAVTGGTGTNYSYKYTLAGLVGTAPVGAISDGPQTGLFFCSTQNSITYTPNPSPILTQNATDGVTVKAFTGPGCISTSLIGTASAAGITVTASGLLITPHAARIQQTTSQTFAATLTTAVSGTTYTYQWGVSGSGGGATLGSIAEGGGTQAGAGFCSTINNVSYTPNATPIISTPASDAISVQAFSGTGCVAANAVSGVISTSVTVIPSPTSRNIPLTEGIYTVMEASDGNYYASSSTGNYCFNNAANGTSYSCGSIYQITPSGKQNLLYQFPADQSSGVQPGMLLEGPNGLLYGLTQDGVYFSISLTGKFTALAQTPLVRLPLFSSYPQNLLLGSDGYFYGVQEGGATILRIGLDGQFESVYTLNSYGGGCDSTPLPPNIIDFIEGADGNFYVAMGLECNVNVVNGGALVQLSRTGAQTVQGIAPLGALIHNGTLQFRNLLTQAADGNFYFVAYAYSAYEDVIRLTPQGNFSSAYRLFSPGLPYALEPGLQIASDGNLYGAGAIFGTIGAGGVAYYPPPCNSTTGANCFFKFQLTTGGGYSTLYSFGGGNQGTYPDGANGAVTTQTGIQNDLGELVGGASNYLNLQPLAVLYQINNQLPPPIQLTFSNSTTLVNQAVTLNWSVLDAFSLSGQQCYAFVPGGAAGAGLWTGKQYGTVNGAVYSGAATIKPTAAGTYTYALTCGGRESGFATLTVQ
jgi:hypothetical protein